MNSKETGTIPASRILKPVWRLTCRSSPVLLNDKVLQHTRVLVMRGLLPREDFRQTLLGDQNGSMPAIKLSPYVLTLYYREKEEVKKVLHLEVIICY